MEWDRGCREQDLTALYSLAMGAETDWEPVQTWTFVEVDDGSKWQDAWRPWADSEMLGASSRDWQAACLPEA